MTDALYDIIEVEIAEPHHVRVMDTRKTEENADAFIKFAVMRRGVETHFYKAVPSGSYRDGDKLR